MSLCVVEGKSYGNILVHTQCYFGIVVTVADVSHIDLQIHFKLNPLMPRVEIHMHPAVPGELNLRVSMLLCRPKFDSPIALTALVPAVCPNSREWRNTSLFFSPPARVSCEEEEKKRSSVWFSALCRCAKKPYVYLCTCTHGRVCVTSAW